MATHSSVIAWRIPGTGEPGGLPSMGSHRVGHDWSDLAAVLSQATRLWIQTASDANAVSESDESLKVFILLSFYIARSHTKPGWVCVCVCVLVAQWCLTLCDPLDCSPPGSSVHGILQAGILEWVAIPYSRRSSQPRNWTRVSCIVGRFFTIWDTRETPGLV